MSALNGGTPFMLSRPHSALARGVLEWARRLDVGAAAPIEVRRSELAVARA